MTQLREAIERLRSRRYRDVDIERDGETYRFRLRSLNAREWYECAAASTIDGQMQPDFMARFVAYSLVDANNEPSMANEEGVVLVSQLDATVIQKLFGVVQDMNGMSVEKKG